jgi:RNA polymerase sigma-70 factor (sigma-E family)
MMAAMSMRDDAVGAPAPIMAARTVAPDPAIDDVERRRVLAELYRDHYRSLVRLAALLVDTTEAAEDVVQEAFVAMFGALDRVEDPKDRAAYLRSVVLNGARGRLRRRRMKRRHDRPTDGVGAAADEGAVLREDQREVIDALRRLPARQRECLVLKFYGDCKETEIAAALGISQGSVKTHLSRAMAAMEKHLEDRR